MLSPPHLPSMAPTTTQLNLNSIKALKLLGKGALGTVFLAYDTISDPSALSPFALKVIHHPTPESLPRAHWELSLLSSLPPHPFLPTLLSQPVQNDQNTPLLCWAIPFCPGGDLNQLRYHQTDRSFTPNSIRFYLAEIICALSHLHSMGIAYRDLKPENILVQGSGHVTLTDFDLSRKLTFKNPTKEGPESKEKDFKGPVKGKRFTRVFSSGSGLKSNRVSPVIRREMSFAGGRRSESFVGTEEYVSPEVVKGEGHEFGVDWWALGVLAYEMLYGKTPFKGRNRKETFRNVVLMKPEFPGQRTALTDLIQRLLEKDPIKRLGYYRGAEEIKEHEFFNGLGWDLLTEVVRPPFVPSMEEYEDLTAKVTPFDIKEYFEKMRAPSSFHSSPSNSFSLSSEDEKSISLTRF